MRPPAEFSSFPGMEKCNPPVQSIYTRVYGNIKGDSRVGKRNVWFVVVVSGMVGR